MALSANELKAMQRRQWHIEGGEQDQKKVQMIKVVPVRKPNKYLNIIRGDIDYLSGIFTNGYKRWRKNREIYRDFMEQHFGR